MSSRGPGGEPLSAKELGIIGERIAARFLWTEGLRILYRNFRAPKGGEVDIVARDRDILAFIEVKTRRGERFGRPIEAVDEAKQRLVARGAMAWLKLLDYPDVRFRFDVVEVVALEGHRPEVRHVRDAFQLPEPLIYP